MIGIFVFSYNRGVFLENCLNSIERANTKGYDVHIIDDSSDDSYTQNAMRRAEKEKKYKTHSSSDQNGEYKTGGLYGAMNLALAISARKGYKYLLFIQDDMQFTRELSQWDIDNFDNYFANNPKSLQISICFHGVKGIDNLADALTEDLSGVAWIYKPEREQGKSRFSAVGLFSMERVTQHLGRFDVGEHVNASRCADLGLYRGLYRAPLMHWLPFPKSYRGKKRSFAHSAIEWICGAGFHPLEFKAGTPPSNLYNWGDNEVITERALISKTAPNAVYWTGAGGVEQIFARGGWRMHLFNALQSVRKKLRASQSGK